MKSWINSKILITPPLFNNLYQGVEDLFKGLCMIRIGDWETGRLGARGQSKLLLTSYFLLLT